MCGVCIFHEWYKTKSHACGKPRLLQATLLQEPESHNMRHLPWYSSSSNDIELGILAKSHAVAAGTSGFLVDFQRGAFFLALAFFAALSLARGMWFSAMGVQVAHIVRFGFLQECRLEQARLAARV